MDPNSTHQLWSRWTWYVRPGRTLALPFEPVKLVLTNFVRSQFGSTGQMRITEPLDHYLIDVRIEGRPAHDPDYVRITAPKFEAFFVSQFGVGTVVRLHGPRVEAGSRQDGRPPDQLVIIPSIPLL